MLAAVRFTAALAAAVLCPTLDAARVLVTVEGTVDYTIASTGFLASVNDGDPAQMSFSLDSDVYDDGMNTFSRGYPIDVSSFTLTIGDVELGLVSSTVYLQVMSSGQSNGFRLSASPDYPVDPHLDQNGPFGPHELGYSVGYGDVPIDSLDIADHVGEHGSATSYASWHVDDLLLALVSMNYESMTIELVEDGCVGDVDDDGSIGAGDLLAVLAAWGSCGGCTADLDGDGVVAIGDVLSLLAAWGDC